jgi:hypothetical protein
MSPLTDRKVAGCPTQAQFRLSGDFSHLSPLSEAKSRDLAVDLLRCPMSRRIARHGSRLFTTAYSGLCGLKLRRSTHPSLRDSLIFVPFPSAEALGDWEMSLRDKAWGVAVCL